MTATTRLFDFDPIALDLITLLRLRARLTDQKGAAPPLTDAWRELLRAALDTAVRNDDAFDTLFDLYLSDCGGEADELDPDPALIRRALFGGEKLAGLDDTELARLAVNPVWVAALRDAAANEATRPKRAAVTAGWRSARWSATCFRLTGLAASIVVAALGFAALSLWHGDAIGPSRNSFASRSEPLLECELSGESYARLPIHLGGPQAPAAIAGQGAERPRTLSSANGRLAADLRPSDPDEAPGLLIDVVVLPGKLTSRLVEYRFEEADGKARERGYMLLREGTDTKRWSAQRIVPVHAVVDAVAATGPAGRFRLRCVGLAALGPADRGLLTAAIAYDRENGREAGDWDELLQAAPPEARP